jgi:branched-chain amino acid transport system substrate-binding protein
MKKIVWLFILFCTILSFGKCSKLKEDYDGINYINPIKIGFLGPFSEGLMGTEGKYLGAFLAAEEINAAGGILGRKIQIVSRNDGGSANIGIKEATTFHNQGIDLILGAEWSSVTLAVAKAVTIPNQMLLMSYASTNPTISTLTDNDLVWRTCPSDVFQGKIGAIYCRNYLHKKTSAILAFNNPWAIGLSNAFRENFENLGGTNSYFGVYPELLESEASKYDYTAYLDSVFKSKPEIIYLASFGADGSKITNDIAKNKYLGNGYNPVFFSNDGIYTNNFLINGNISVIDNFYGTVPGSSKMNNNYNTYSNNYYSRWGFEPTAYSEYAYDAMYLLAYAILKNNGVTYPKQLASYLRDISGTPNNTSATKINVNEFSKAKVILLNSGKIDYDGASGKIEFDKNGDPSSGTYLIWKIKNGKFLTDTIVTFP